ncbi:MAG: DUF721 domain-containing protein [Humidesulfovibrio sp.]|nr:DUF721 domain-containing protein [Humidesulfovibrio sp.]
MQHPGRESRHRKLGADLLLRAVSRFDKKGGLKLVRLWREWENIVGAEVAELARPLGHKDGSLLLCTYDSIAAQQLSYYVPELLERINAFYGELVFDKVRFELLDGRVPLGLQSRADSSTPPKQQKKPSNLGALVETVDPNTAVGHCYLAYVRHFLGHPAQLAATDANTCPTGASRRGK